MRYLIPFTIILALLGCDNNSGRTQDDDRVDSKNVTSYLDKPLTGKIIQHGLYKLLRSGGVVDDPNTNTGKVTAKPVLQQVNSSERIPLIRGAQMYLQYRIKPFPDRPAWVDLRQVLKHPEMTLPDGSVSTGSDIPFKSKVNSNQSIGFIGYCVDEDYELVEGDWVFEVWYQDKKMVEQTFTTYWPDEEERVVLDARLAPSRGKERQLRSTPVPEKDWPVKVEYDIGDNPELKDVVPLSEPSGTTD